MEKIRNFVINLSPVQYGICWFVWLIAPEILGVFTRDDVLNDKVTNATITSNIAFSVFLSLYSIFLIYALVVRKQFYKNQQVTCNACGHQGRARIITPGNIITEVLLWSLLVPGIIYSLWRKSRRYRECTACGAKII